MFSLPRVQRGQHRGSHLPPGSSAPDKAKTEREYLSKHFRHDCL
jgi:hypothetical protein